MRDINYFGAIVKILENPTQILLKNNISVTKFRVQLPQSRNNKTTIVNLVFWDNLANDAVNYYKTNEYLLIEGYLGLPKKLNSKRVEITVLKVYSFPLNSYRSFDKT
jgi:hypothetical protein